MKAKDAAKLYKETPKSGQSQVQFDFLMSTQQQFTDRISPLLDEKNFKKFSFEKICSAAKEAQQKWMGFLNRIGLDDTNHAVFFLMDVLVEPQIIDKYFETYPQDAKLREPMLFVRSEMLKRKENEETSNEP